MVEPLAVDRPIEDGPIATGLMTQSSSSRARRPPGSSGSPWPSSQPSSSEGNHVEDGRASSGMSRIAGRINAQV